MPGRVNLVRPSDGAVVSVPEENVATLEALGYRPEESGEMIARAGVEADKERYSTLGQRVGTFAEGAASAATFGASDLALDALGADTAYRAAENPGTRFVGELSGAVATGALAGGAGIAGKVARATPAGRLTAFATRAAETRLGVGLASKVAGGAVEGAAGGLGGEVANTVLSGDPLTVERAFAGAGYGALFGAGAGALAHGMTKAADYRAARAAASLEDEVAEAAGRGTGRDRVLRYDEDTGMMREVGEDFDGKTVVERRRYPADFDDDTVVERARPGRGAAIPQESLDSLRTAVDDLTTAVDDLGPAPAGDPDATAPGKPRFTGRRRTPRAGRTVETEGHVGPATQETDWAVAHGRVTKAWRDANEQAGTRQGDALRIRYRAHVADAAEQIGLDPPKWRDGGDLFDDGGVGYPIVRRLEALRGVTPEAHREMVAAARELREAMPRTTDELAGMTEARQERVNAAVEAAIRAKVPHAAAAQSALQAAVDDLAKGSGVVAEGAGPGASLRSTWAVAKSARSGKGARRGGHAVRNVLGRTAIDATMGRQIGPALARHALMSVMFGAVGTAKETAVNAALRVVGTRAGARATRAAGPRAWGLYRSADGVQEPESDLRDAFRRRSEEIRELSTVARDRAFAGVAGLISEGHGDFAAEAYKGAVRAVEVLARRVPKDPPGTRWGQESMWEAPEEQVEVFAQEYGAVTSPLEFLAWAAEAPDEVLPSAVDALREAWPATYEDFRVRALEALSQQDLGDRPAGDLQALSIILDYPMVPTYTPEFISAQAAMFAAPPAEPQARPPSPGGRPPGPSNNPEATASERMALR